MISSTVMPCGCEASSGPSPRSEASAGSAKHNISRNHCKKRGETSRYFIGMGPYSHCIRCGCRYADRKQYASTLEGVILSGGSSAPDAPESKYPYTPRKTLQGPSALRSRGDLITRDDKTRDFRPPADLD